jgi:O-antigen/teichoic acid export membrane protein
MKQPSQTLANPEHTPPSQPRSKEAERLIRRAPMGYLWNQLASLWLFGASFLFNLLTARLGIVNFGILAVTTTVYNTGVYLAAFGLEDASSVFIPRALAEGGKGAAAAVIRRLLVTRVLFLTAVGVGIVVLVPEVAHVAASLHPDNHSFLKNLAGADRVPGLDALALPVAAYVFGMGLMNQFTAIFTSLLRTRMIFIIGGLSQVANLVAVVVVLRSGYGVEGIIWGVAASAWLASLAYALALAPWLTRRNTAKVAVPSFAPVLRLGGSAWLINLVNGALLKQVVISLFGAFLISYEAIGYFNLAFQLTHAAAYLLISGLGGVGLAAMSAAYSGQDRAGLAFAWRAVSKVHILLSVPLLVFVFIHAGAIINVFYGSAYSPAAMLMQIFLLFNITYLLAGGNAHQAALYVLGRQRIALIINWASLALTAVLAAILIPRGGAIGGPTGALVAIGISQVGAVLVQLAYAWRLLHAKYPIRFSVRVLLALIPATVVAFLIHPSAWSWFPRQVGPVMVPLALSELVLSVLLFTLVLVFGLWLAKPIEHVDVDLLAQTNPRLRPILSPFASGAPSPRMVISKQSTKPIKVGDAARLPESRRPTDPTKGKKPATQFPIGPQHMEE